MLQLHCRLNSNLSSDCINLIAYLASTVNAVSSNPCDVSWKNVFQVPEFWLQFFRILFSAGFVALERVLQSLCIYIVWYISLRVRGQNFCSYKFGSKSIMVDLFTIVQPSISSMHKPVVMKRSEFNTHCRSIFHLNVSWINKPFLWPQHLLPCRTPQTDQWELIAQFL